MNKYSYKGLSEKALAPDATQQDVNALGSWFTEYGSGYWNGEFYEVDESYRLYPVFEEVEEGEFMLVGYKLQ